MISKGIHHITAIAGNPQTNLDFYSGLLGLKFIKRTINFDDPGTYHFYYGNETGNPGTILTFFPWGQNAHRGSAGRGQVISYAFSIPEGSMDFWQKKLTKYKVIFTGPYERFGEKVLTFNDPDGIEVELIEGKNHSDDPYAVHGFHSATLSAESLLKTEASLKNILGFELRGNEDKRYRFSSDAVEPGAVIDVIVSPDSLKGYMGVGAVHHIAFRASDDEMQMKMRESAEEELLSATPVIDRKYFRSVYFREHNGILFEIATDQPGFMVDEEKEKLGQKLQLPEWLENKRDVIEKSLQQLVAPSPERIFLIE